VRRTRAIQFADLEISSRKKYDPARSLSPAPRREGGESNRQNPSLRQPRDGKSGNDVSVPSGFSEAEARPNRRSDRVATAVAVRQATIHLREHQSGIGIKLLRKLPINDERNRVHRPMAGCERHGVGPVDGCTIGGLIVVWPTASAPKPTVTRRLLAECVKEASDAVVWTRSSNMHLSSSAGYRSRQRKSEPKPSCGLARWPRGRKMKGRCRCKIPEVSFDRI
jgi:hypothetical protein